MGNRVLSIVLPDIVLPDIRLLDIRFLDMGTSFPPRNGAVAMPTMASDRWG
jgi:hypothetical protein